MSISVKKKQSPFRFLLRNCKKLVLWVILYFCFKHDFEREDFVFIPIQAGWVLAIICALDVADLIEKYLLKVELDKVVSFKEWYTKRIL